MGMKPEALDIDMNFISRFCVVFLSVTVKSSS